MLMAVHRMVLDGPETEWSRPVDVDGERYLALAPYRNGIVESLSRLMPWLGRRMLEIGLSRLIKLGLLGKWADDHLFYLRLLREGMEDLLGKEVDLGRADLGLEYIPVSLGVMGYGIVPAAVHGALAELGEGRAPQVARRLEMGRHVVLRRLHDLVGWGLAEREDGVRPYLFRSLPVTVPQPTSPPPSYLPPHCLLPIGQLRPASRRVYVRTLAPACECGRGPVRWVRLSYVVAAQGNISGFWMRLCDACRDEEMAWSRRAEYERYDPAQHNRPPMLGEMLSALGSRVELTTEHRARDFAEFLARQGIVCRTQGSGVWVFVPERRLRRLLRYWRIHRFGMDLKTGEEEMG